MRSGLAIVVVSLAALAGSFAGCSLGFMDDRDWLRDDVWMETLTLTYKGHTSGGGIIGPEGQSWERWISSSFDSSKEKKYWATWRAWDAMPVLDKPMRYRCLVRAKPLHGGRKMILDLWPE